MAKNNSARIKQLLQIPDDDHAKWSIAIDNFIIRYRPGTLAFGAVNGYISANPLFKTNKKQASMIIKIMANFGFYRDEDL